MKKKFKMLLIIIATLIGLVSIVGVGKLFFKKEEEKKPENEAKVISNIETYGYSLDDRDTKYMTEVFKELEKVLNEEEVDEKLYAELISKLFIIDFYTLNNKINKYDVGGFEYIYNDKADMFKTKAIDTFYRDIIDNTYKDRVQKLPEITSVEVVKSEALPIKIDKDEKEGYKVELKYTYKEDLGYDKSGIVSLIKNGNKLEVVAYNPLVEKNSKS